MFGLFNNDSEPTIVIHGPDGKYHQTLRGPLSRNAIEGFMKNCPDNGLTVKGHRYWKVPTGSNNWVSLKMPNGSDTRIYGGSTLTYICE